MKKLLFKSTLLVACFCVATLTNAQTLFDVDGKLHVNAAGNVGIGTTTPTQKVDLFNGKMYLSNDGGVSDPEIRIWSEDGLNLSSYRIRDLAGTQVRMDKRSASGPATVDYNPMPLDNLGTASFRFFRNSNTTGDVFFTIYKGDNTATINGQIGGNTNTYFATDNSNVGIGTAVPTFLLHVNGVAAKPGGGSWTVASDARLKKDIKEFTDGLELIKQIEPKTFTYNGKAGIKTTDEFVGIIAQDMQKIAPYMVSEFEAEDGNTYLSFNPSALDFVLVNAMKEQEEKIEALEEEVAKSKNYDDAIKNLQELVSQLQNENQTLLNQMNQFDIDLQQCCLSHSSGSVTGSTNGLHDKAHLAQNIPNPFNSITIIKYYLPKDAAQAQIRISDMKGNLLKVVEVYEKGYGQTTIDANILAPGTYTYELIVGNERIDTKRMIIQK